MAFETINYGSNFNAGSPLTQLLDADCIQPGEAPSYQLCKIIWLYHVLGGKMAEAPIRLAQSQEREIAITKGPENMLKDAFLAEWTALKATELLFQFYVVSRVYGESSLALLVKGEDSARPFDPLTLWNKDISFSVFDPLNTSGSLVLNQNPNALDFMKTDGDIRVSGQVYHRSRVVTKFNGPPVYLAYTPSSFGFVGRSVYQRGLYPLQSFIATMRTDELVAVKSGVFVAKMKAAASLVGQQISKLFGNKSEIVKQARTFNVITISTEESIETLNMQNIDGAYGMARSNILKNIATSADMPAVLLENETLTEGFSEGTEDANTIAQYIDTVRADMGPGYQFMDRIVMRRAWNPEFYLDLQEKFKDEWGPVSYEDAFSKFEKGFKISWPSSRKEPESEKAKADDVKLKGIIALLEVLLPVVDPETKATMIQFAADNFNELKTMFANPLNIDINQLREYLVDQQSQQQEMMQASMAEPAPPKPFGASA